MQSETEALSAKLGQLLLGTHGWLATAESCTGGLLAGAVTGIAGSSGDPGADDNRHCRARGWLSGQTCWLGVVWFCATHCRGFGGAGSLANLCWGSNRCARCFRSLCPKYSLRIT